MTGLVQWSYHWAIIPDRLTVSDVPFEVFRRSTLPEEIANRLLTLIQDRELRPGDKLPPERELAAMMGVSRQVLREALRALAIMRVVDIRQGDGTYITSLEPKQLISHLDFVLGNDDVTLGKLFEARRVVEAGNVRFAAERITDESIARLDDLLGSLAATIDDPDRFSEADIAFHDTVCDAADNFLLSQFMTIVDTLGKVSRQRTGRARAMRDTALADHRAIFEALRDHDPDAAERAMRTHLDHVEAVFAEATAGLDADARSTATPADVLARGADSVLAR